MLHVIMGGTFDPVHHGHLRVAVEMRERLDAERIHLIPSAVPPHRPQPGASGAQRLAMLEAAVAGEPGLIADDRELCREDTSWTVLTLRELRRELGPDVPLVVVLGTDAFDGLADWYEAEQVPQLAHVVVVERPDSPLDRLSSRACELLNEVLSVTALKDSPAGSLLVLSPPLLDISATGVRERVQDGRSIRYLVPDSVAAYIEHRELYRRGDAPADSF